ncbi:MAG: hypothetical protein HY586_00995, partial [Candidatus Omnitrophica bacterium]|nr:hypothetical protein [Candidatus Omnitrophota bacterium]
TDYVSQIQGTSPKVGDFVGIRGLDIDEVIARVPKDWELLPQAGSPPGIRFVQRFGPGPDDFLERVRIHGPNSYAPIGSNDYEGWTVMISAQGIPKVYYDNAGRLVWDNGIARRFITSEAEINSYHIPLKGNPNLNPSLLLPYLPPPSSEGGDNETPIVDTTPVAGSPDDPDTGGGVLV